MPSEASDLIVGIFRTPDAVAVAYLFLASALFSRAVRNRKARRPSASILMDFYRREWMRRMSERDPRMIDAQLIAEIRRGTSFFASTALLLLSGGVALFGNVEFLEDMLVKVGLVDVPNVPWEIKIALALLLLAHAMTTFILSHRLMGYAVVVIGAVHAPGHPKTRGRAEQAADLCNNGAEQFRSGLQSLYFAGAAITWLLGPVVLTAAVTLTLMLLWRREYSDTARGALLDRPPDQETP